MKKSSNWEIEELVMNKKVNINTASVEELIKLPGIGKVLAERIIEYRNRIGRFRVSDEMAAVPGISSSLANKLENRITVPKSEEDEIDDLPLTILKVIVSDPNSESTFGGYNLVVFHKRCETITDQTSNTEALWFEDQITKILPKDGEVEITLPNKINLQGDVKFQVSAPDGEVLYSKTVPSERLSSPQKFEIISKTYAETKATEDPSFGLPSRIRGRVIDRMGKIQVANRQVILWGQQAEADDFIPLLVGRTDNSGYFSGEYPIEDYFDAYGEVSFGVESVTTPIHLDKNDRFPESVILVIDLPVELSDVISSETINGSDEVSSSVPRDPDMADLTRGDGVFSSDPGAGQCVEFTKPNRTLEEFSYSYVVRTTQPNIKGMTLKEPEKIDVSKIVGILGDTSSNVEREIDDDNFSLSKMFPSTNKKESKFSKSKIDARVLKTFGNDPDGFSLTKLAAASRLTTQGDLSRVLAWHINHKPNRNNLTCDLPIDWDDEPTIYQACNIAHGHILNFKQEWVADGYSMGDLLYSLPLAPGQKKQVAIVDWERRESAERTEELTETEALRANLSRDRDINEVVYGTLEERTRGGSKSSTGSISGGGGIGGFFKSLGGLLGIGGGSSSASSSAWQTSSRKTSATALNQLRDRTMQSASSVRSQRSSVVQTIKQGERVMATTETVANYNHCHAITIQYFEVLRHLLVRQRLVDVQECLFVPLLMSRFNREKVLRWQNALQRVLPTQSLRNGVEAIERIVNHYQGSNLPVGSYADQDLENLTGHLRIRFQLARPHDKDDVFDPDAWSCLHALLGITPQEFYNDHLRDQRFKDRIFLEQLGPQIAERFIQHMQFYAILKNGKPEKLPIDATMPSNFTNNQSLYVSLRLEENLPPIKRSDIENIEISGTSKINGLFLISLLPKNSRVIVESGSMRYQTQYHTDYLFRDAYIKNDIKRNEHVRIYTPLNHRELFNPRKRDQELSRQLLYHLNENIERYHHAIWWQMSSDRRYMLMDGFIAPNSGGRSVASVVDNNLIGIAGNCLILPVSHGFHLDPTYRQDGQNPIDLLEHYQPNTPIEPVRIALPTKGVYAESVIGSCNSCEHMEEDRFWRWEESPIPDSPTGITPISTESRRSEETDLTAKDFPSPMINLQTAPAAPDPTGLASVMKLLGTENLFKDITGLEGTQKNAIEALKSAYDTAKFFGDKASNLALQGKMSKDIDKTLKTIQNAKNKKLITEKQAQELTAKAITAMLGGGTKKKAKSMTVKDVNVITDKAGKNKASVSVSRPDGEKITVDARVTVTSGKNEDKEKKDKKNDEDKDENKDEKKEPNEEDK
jgi:competence ComEA-like helix-hairpin-helix protein